MGDTAKAWWGALVEPKAGARQATGAWKPSGTKATFHLPETTRCPPSFLLLPVRPIHFLSHPQRALALFVLHVAGTATSPDTLPWPHSSVPHNELERPFLNPSAGLMEKMWPIFHPQRARPQRQNPCRRLCQRGWGAVVWLLCVMCPLLVRTTQVRRGGWRPRCVYCHPFQKLSDGKKPMKHMSHQGVKKNYSSMPWVVEEWHRQGITGTWQKETLTQPARIEEGFTENGTVR